MCPLIFGSFTHHQVVILTGYLAIVTYTNREKSSGSTCPYAQAAPPSPTPIYNKEVMYPYKFLDYRARLCYRHILRLRTKFIVVNLNVVDNSATRTALNQVEKRVD